MAGTRGTTLTPNELYYGIEKTFSGGERYIWNSQVLKANDIVYSFQNVDTPINYQPAHEAAAGASGREHRVLLPRQEALRQEGGAVGDHDPGRVYGVCVGCAVLVARRLDGRDGHGVHLCRGCALLAPAAEPGLGDPAAAVQDDAARHRGHGGRGDVQRLRGFRAGRRSWRRRGRVRGWVW